MDGQCPRAAAPPRRDRLRVALPDDRERTVPIEWFDWALIEDGAGIWWNRLDESLSVGGPRSCPPR